MFYGITFLFVFFIIILLFLLYKFKNIEKFSNEDDDIVPDQGNGFATVQQKENDRKKEMKNKVGSANDWGGKPENPDEEDPKSSAAQKQLSDCKQKLEDVNTNFQTYLTTKARKDRLGATSRIIDQEKNASDIKEVIDMFKDQTKVNTENLNKTLEEINKERESLQNCNQMVKPLDEQILFMKLCCDTQKKIADGLTKQFQDCQESTANIKQKIDNEEQTLADLKNQLNDLQNTNNSLTNTLNECTSKRDASQKTLDNCTKY
jgi:predicted RNase H-like nuclease (RuvC/YqgF family)